MMLRWILILSLCCSVVLGAVFLSKWRDYQKEQIRRAIPDLPQPRERAISNRRAQSELTPVVVEAIEPFHWSQVEAADYREYMENLRAIGCPERTILRMIVADVNADYSRRVGVWVKEPMEQFWSLLLRPRELEKLVNEKQEEIRALDEERKKLLQALFNGADPEQMIQNEFTMTNAMAEYRWKLDFLTDDEFERVRELRSRVEMARHDIEQEYQQRKSDPEFKAKLNELESWEKNELGAFLSRDAIEEIELRMGSASGKRFELLDLDATESEVRAIAIAGTDPERQQALRELLGNERYAALQRSFDPGYQQAFRITEKFQLPESTAVEVYQVQQEVETAARVLREDNSRPIEERIAALTALRDQTARTLSGKLGERAFKTYERNAGWLAQMTQGVK